jgi:zinc protease
VKSFFTTYYVPNNATLVIAGDVDPVKTRALVEKYLGWIPRGAEPKRPAYKVPAPITKEIRLTARDDVQVPKVFMAWRAPAGYAPEQAAGKLGLEVLGGGKSSRLYERLVFRERLAQDVVAYYDESELGGAAYIEITPKPGVDPEKLIAGASEELDRLVKSPPSAAELERVKNVTEARFLLGLESILARAIKLSMYDVLVKDPDFLGKDLERFRKVTEAEIAGFARKYLGRSQRVVLVISPQEKKK